MKSKFFLAVFLVLAPMVCQAQTSGPLAIPAGATVEVGYSPGGSALKLVLDTIASARHDIWMAAYEFTSLPILQALEAAQKRGVSIHIVMDDGAAKSKSSQFQAAKRAGFEIREVKRYAIFHHKFMVIDQRDVETGSFNYTKNAAEHNAENVLVLHNVPDLAAVYLTEWKRLWNEAR